MRCVHQRCSADRHPFVFVCNEFGFKSLSSHCADATFSTAPERRQNALIDLHVMHHTLKSSFFNR